MYIDLIVLIALLIFGVLFSKRFYSFVFFIAFIDIFLRIITFIKNNIGLKDVSNIIGKYLPESIIDIINKYTSNIEILNIILKWGFVIIMCIFLYYIAKIFWKRKRI